MRRPAPEWLGPQGRLTAWLLLLALGLAAVTVGIGALWQTGSARERIPALAGQGEGVARDREQAAETGRALARPALDPTLGLLRAHLPPDIRLVEAARGEDGALSLAIDTPDPDALRAALAADSRLARFRERGQEARDDGTIRVRLTGDML
ncbi:hypothetical protein HL653_07555 [Sphingomonas sp. AP4-R1]|uniref:hypothetical protein n=1 Tax=Sphingomonas sp. AP4-R1 TaxID=2735134 RepID=UPI001493DBAE|nr:hypothetical protein [Sphingomonas sp. AP4-R1]QJU57663.1 hypothetical protein HL653_07555 [Sphingomonas sp. AP4-R1]